MSYMQDIYFDPNYGKLYEKAENGKAVVWEYNGKEGKVSHQFIVREIPIKLENEPWYDIVTPYGYGGPLICNVSEGCTRNELVSAFEKAFGEYCSQNRIVSEFVRFHPIIKNADDFADMYNTKCIRKTLGTNLEAYDDPVAFEFSKSCRKDVRRALDKGISWRITAAPDNVDGFKEVYFSTMDRNNASDYYYFDDEYFANCLKYFKENVIFAEAIYNNKIIAAGLYFAYNGIIHIHLSGTLSEYLSISPTYVLNYAITVWGKENGYKLIHRGGGTSNSEDNSLYLFKKKFSRNTEFEFYVGKKIWNKSIYEKLCEMNGNNAQSEFFPAYRESKI